MGVGRRQTQLRRSAQETLNLYGDLILNTATDIANNMVGTPKGGIGHCFATSDATTTTIEGDVRLEIADDVFEATAEISDKQAQITDEAPLLDIQTQRYEEPKQEKIRNRFLPSALLEVGPQNYQEHLID
ncbi:hypothetical protein Tco_0723962 [Tanacetum coccineum]